MSSQRENKRINMKTKGTIVAHNNKHTINFEEPILRPSRIRLISASFYNSWNALKSAAEITITNNSSKKQTGINIPSGHYTLKSMANKLTKLFNKNDIDLSIETDISREEMAILNPNEYAIWLDLKLHELFTVILLINRITCLMAGVQPF